MYWLSQSVGLSVCRCDRSAYMYVVRKCFCNDVSTRKMDWCMSIKRRNIVYLLCVLWARLHVVPDSYTCRIKMRHTKKDNLFMYLYILTFVCCCSCSFGSVCCSVNIKLFLFSFRFCSLSLFSFLFHFTFHLCLVLTLSLSHAVRVCYFYIINHTYYFIPA